MKFFSTLTLATVFGSAGLLANANPIKRQAGQLVTITDFFVEIISGNNPDNASFIIQTGSENITCSSSGNLSLPTVCDCDLWKFSLVSDEHNDAVNMTVSTGTDGSITSGETAITLFCRGIPGAEIETENCDSLAAVEEGGQPTIITLESAAN